jgi:hypothetical protein
VGRGVDFEVGGSRGEGPCVDIMEISKPDNLGDIANLGLTLEEAKQLLARVQCEISTAQARGHAVRRPVCPCGEDVCRVKDYRDHSVATLFGQVTMRLPRFLCALCGRIETGINWPSHCRSTPELDRLRAHLSALMGSVSARATVLVRLRAACVYGRGGKDWLDGMRWVRLGSCFGTE